MRNLVSTIVYEIDVVAIYSGGSDTAASGSKQNQILMIAGPWIEQSQIPKRVIIIPSALGGN